LSLYSNVPKDVNGNAVLGVETKFADSHNCIVNTRGVKSVVVVGMNDCIISENEGNLLVCRMSDEDRIKEFSEER
jgi:mannose-1-phosphate guanylyltransferase